MIARLLALVACLAAWPAGAKVIAANEQGMVIETEAAIAAPPEKVWALLIAPARWWSAKHSWSGDAANFTLDPRAGGCFCERLPDGGSVEHLRVVYVQPRRLLRLYGGLGPLQGDAAAGPLTWTLAPAAGGTALKLRYAVSGVTRMPWPVFAPLAETMLSEQVAQLKAAAEAK